MSVSQINQSINQECCEFLHLLTSDDTLNLWLLLHLLHNKLLNLTNHQIHSNASDQVNFICYMIC